MRYLISLYGIFLFSLISCNKCQNEISDLSAEVQDFYNVKEGSYWLMRDSVTNDLDSFAFYSNGTGYSTPDYFSKHCYRQFQYAVLNITCPAKNNLNLEIASTNGGIIGFTIQDNSTIYGRVSTTEIAGFDMNNISVNGQSYDSVTLCSYQDASEAYFINTYIDKAHTLLKLVIRKDNLLLHTWELEKANIIR